MAFFWLPFILTHFLYSPGSEDEIALLKEKYFCEYPNTDKVMEFAITPHQTIILSDGNELEKDQPLCLLSGFENLEDE